MTEKERRKRLEALRKETPTELSAEKLLFSDLLLLLQHDPEVRRLVRNIVTEPDEVATIDIDDEVPHPVASAAPSRPESAVISASLGTDPIRQQLGAELKLLKIVQADRELAADWLGSGEENEGRLLIRLVARAAQWDVLSDLWERFAKRCKEQQRAAHQDELTILHAALALHNLRWQGRQASLREVSTGIPYDYHQHQRGTPTGDVIKSLWLPGLVNAGGDLQKKPLVQT